jgi:hypothetical protein
MAIHFNYAPQFHVLIKQSRELMVIKAVKLINSVFETMMGTIACSPGSTRHHALKEF